MLDRDTICRVSQVQGRCDTLARLLCHRRPSHCRRPDMALGTSCVDLPSEDDSDKPLATA